METPVLPQTAPDADLQWGASVRHELDSAVNQFVQGFVAAPYRHRVEHSLECDLVAALRTQPTLGAGVIQLADGHQSALIHREWPGPVIHRLKQQRRANIDVVVLPPRDESQAISLDQYRQGRITPYAGFEVGLDADQAHFNGDRQKLAMHGLAVQYLIHLARTQNPVQLAIRQAIDALRNTATLSGGRELVLVAAFPASGGGFDVLLPSAREWQHAGGGGNGLQ